MTNPSHKVATCLKTTRFYASIFATAHLSAEVFYRAFLSFFRTQCESKPALEQLRVVEPRTGGPSFGALLGASALVDALFFIEFPPQV